jgi:hypothetical protein
MENNNNKDKQQQSPEYYGNWLEASYGFYNKCVEMWSETVKAWAKGYNNFCNEMEAHHKKYSNHFIKEGNSSSGSSHE